MPDPQGRRGGPVPVIESATGNCHVYVDAQADLDMAVDILVNSKAQRPSVCNAAETLLVHQDIAAEFLPRALDALAEAGVTVHADERVLAYAKGAKATVVEATTEDWDTEYLSYDIAAAVVDSLDKAVAHIRLWSSGHTEAIVTTSQQAARRFTQLVDSTTVAVNASTRFTDGGQFGFGAEIGISTQKLHARGPMGLPELTSTKYIVTATATSGAERDRRGASRGVRRRSSGVPEESLWWAWGPVSRQAENFPTVCPN